MINIVNDKLESIREFCVRYSVKRLEIFGSAALDDAGDLSVGDIDFLVEFGQSSPVAHCSGYFSLLEELETLFNRHIDLVEIKAIRNPYFMRRVNESRRLIYAA
jgi:hypothetical protein